MQVLELHADKSGIVHLQSKVKLRPWEELHRTDLNMLRARGSLAMLLLLLVLLGPPTINLINIRMWPPHDEVLRIWSWTSHREGVGGVGSLDRGWRWRGVAMGWGVGGSFIRLGPESDVKKLQTLCDMFSLSFRDNVPWRKSDFFFAFSPLFFVYLLFCRPQS